MNRDEADRRLRALERLAVARTGRIYDPDLPDHEQTPRAEVERRIRALEIYLEAGP